MRLSGLSLAVLLTSSILFAQHSSGGGSSSSASSSSSSGGGSHSSSSGGSSYSGGSSSGGHNSGGGHSSSGGSSHSTGSSHSSGGGHSSGGTRASSSSAHNRIESSSSKMTRPIREPKSGISERVVVPQKRGFLSFLRHPFRKPPPKVVEAKPALYLPRPICPKGRCAPTCPVGQVGGGGACTTPVIPVCTAGSVWNTQACGYSGRYHCALGQIWNGTGCVYGTGFLDRCIGLRMALERQAQRVQNAEAARQRACANGPLAECSDASASWQSEESLRQNLLRRYQQCQIQQYGTYDSSLRFDSLHFNADF